MYFAFVVKRKRSQNQTIKMVAKHPLLKIVVHASRETEESKCVSVLHSREMLLIAPYVIFWFV